MKKLVLLFIIQLLFVFSASIAFCSMVSKIEDKRNEGKATIVIYEKDWETLYSAVKFVLRHSEGIDTNALYSIDPAIEEKAIFFLSRGAGVGIFFEPINDNRTRVEYIKAHFQIEPSLTVDVLIEELPYLLEHGQEAYRKYTRNLALQKEREREEERNRKNRSVFD